MADEGEPTRTLATSSSFSGSSQEGRFPAGTVLAGRYRILGPIGSGGMGEVYKAFDLILNQAVALKFLPPARVSEATLVRFRNEVRVARQVSHPNVCRVYDLGMIEGLHFLSMEYIDGEDLASLLRRIGRLPQDKAIEFARKICAGLSAAHERGVLHRDLKPANIMIDGRGHVRITDFGLAGLAAEIPLSDLRSGTPAYMSPEQAAGKEVTARSDIYSLGLVLHEMFTGKSRRETQSSPSEIVKDLDPAVERLILRCLEEDSKRRPQTALSVAMALPGADPIAAALAAGETPSPEMVAASTEKEGFALRTAVLCFGAILVSLMIGAVLAGKITVAGRAPLDLPPDALAFQAQQILKQLGYSDPPQDTAYGFTCCNSSYPDFLQKYERERRDAILASYRPWVMAFWYRQHRAQFSADRFFSILGPGEVSFDSPANDQPGMSRLMLDPKGRLVLLEIQPSTVDSTEVAAAAPPDWNGLFAAAGLDPARFTPTKPTIVPPMAIDTQMAWTGTYGPDRKEPVHVEAASWKGRIVMFDAAAIAGTRAWAPTTNRSPSSTVWLGLFVAFVLGAAWTAWHNLRLGRGDRRGAAQIAGATFLLHMGMWILVAHHVANLWEFGMLVMAASWAAFLAGTLSMMYMAIEPSVRRNWPDSLISWTRLQWGQIRNPLVASHALAGIAAALVFVWAVQAPLLALMSAPLTMDGWGGMRSAARSLAGFFAQLPWALGIAMGFVLFVVLLRLMLRRLWMADLLAALILGFGGLGVFGPGIFRDFAAVVFYSLVGLVWLWIFRRFGLLAIFVTWATIATTREASISLSGWYAARSLAVQLVPVSVAAWAVWVILSAQPPATEGARR